MKLARKEKAFLPGPAVATARVRKLAVRGLGVRVRYELEKGIKTSGHLRSAAVLGCEFSPRLAAVTELIRAAGRRPNSQAGTATPPARGSPSRSTLELR